VRLVIGRALWQCLGTLSTAEYRMTFPFENHAACCEVYCQGLHSGSAGLCAQAFCTECL